MALIRFPMHITLKDKCLSAIDSTHILFLHGKKNLGIIDSTIVIFILKTFRL